MLPLSLPRLPLMGSSRSNSCCGGGGGKARSWLAGGVGKKVGGGSAFKVVVHWWKKQFTCLGFRLWNKIELSLPLSVWWLYSGTIVLVKMWFSLAWRLAAVVELVLNIRSR
jgi:hypothetical protein